MSTASLSGSPVILPTSPAPLPGPAISALQNVAAAFPGLPAEPGEPRTYPTFPPVHETVVVTCVMFALQYLHRKLFDYRAPRSIIEHEPGRQRHNEVRKARAVSPPRLRFR